jgi:RNA polymerase sigma-B factor
MATRLINRRGGEVAGMEEVRRAELTAMHARYWETRDRCLRDQLIAAYEGFASALAFRYGDRREPREDLRQVALVALIHAFDRYDPSHGAEFLTFAWATIIGSLRRHGRDRTAPMRVSRSLLARGGAVSEALDRLSQQLGRSPTIPELARAMDISPEKVIEALEARTAMQPRSLEADAESAGRMSAVQDWGMELVEVREVVGPLLARLPAREQEILRLRFFEEKSQTEIAAALGMSQMHVSRLLARTLAQLRSWMEDAPAAPAER